MINYKGMWSLLLITLWTHFNVRVPCVGLNVYQTSKAVGLLQHLSPSLSYFSFHIELKKFPPSKTTESASSVWMTTQYIDWGHKPEKLISVLRLVFLLWVTIGLLLPPADQNAYRTQHSQPFWTEEGAVHLQNSHSESVFIVFRVLNVKNAG